MQTAVVIPFQPRIDAIPPAPPVNRANRVCRRTAEVEPVADLLIALERRPLAEPCILADRTLDNLSRVHVVLPDYEAALHPHEARMAAAALNAEQAFPGCSGVAARLTEVADQVDRAARLRPSPTPQGQGTGLRTVIAMAAVALFLAAALLIRGL